MADSMGDLVPVDWWQRIAPSQYDPDGGTRYRNCDLCFQDAIADVWAGKPEEQWRKFFRSQREGLNVCEHCVSRYLNEKQRPSFYEWLNAVQRDELATTQGVNP